VPCSRIPPPPGAVGVGDPPTGPDVANGETADQPTHIRPKRARQPPHKAHRYRGGFAPGASYRAGIAYRRRQVQVSVVGDSVQIEGRLVRTHAIRHDRAKEHGGFADATGRPRRINAA
jgi:hypothetical protein